MFNLYQYERLEQDESKRVNSTTNQPKKIAKYLSKTQFLYRTFLSSLSIQNKRIETYKIVFATILTLILRYNVFM
jgi:hypothetical protein